MPKPLPKHPPAHNAPDEAPPPAMGGGDLGVHLVICVLVASALGYGLDVWLHTSPWGLIGGIALGFAAWLWQIWKMLRPAPPAKP